MANRFFIFYDKVFKLKDGNFYTEIGGVQRYLYELGLIIKGKGLDVFVIQLGQENMTSCCDGINIIQLNCSGKKRFKLAFAHIQEKYNFNGTSDFVIWGADTISIKLPNGVKSISIQHGIACDMIEMDSVIRRFIRNIGLTFIYKFLQRSKALKSFNNSDYRVCVDYNYLNWYRTFQKKNGDEINNIFVIPNFSKVPDFFPDKVNEKIRIGFARRFVYKRGVNLMITLSELLLVKYSNIEIVFAGDGPLRPLIEKLKDKYPEKIILMAFEPADTFEFHSKIDISIVPTIGSEGTSLSLLEAMASHTAVVCTNVGGMSNIVIDNFNGYIINPNVEELFLKVSVLLGDEKLRNKFSQNAYLTVNDGFNYNIWKEKWINLIEKVIENGK